jgi:signal transduction histidine kinase
VIINDSPVACAERVKIDSPCRKLEIRYAAPPLACPEKTKFRYRLDKVDTNWVEAGSQRFAIFSQLPPGDYQFRVTACNNAGVWHPTGAALNVKVKSSLLRNTWFQIAALLALIGSGHCLVQFRRWRQRILFLEEERTRIAQDMHDHVGARLTHIALISEQARRESGLTPAVAEKIATISATTHEVAQTLDEIVWAVEPSNDTVAGVIDYLSQYCSEYAAAADIQLKQDLPEKIPAGTMPSVARHNLVLAVKEALNNAIKHALASEIELRAELETDTLRVQITDNGRGFLLEESRALGNGLRNMEKRLVTSGGRCQIDSRANGGTKVTFELPLGKTGLILRPLLPKKQKGPVVGD